MFSALSWPKAEKYIPNGCQTLSKMPERYVNGVYPKLLVSGYGCEVEDESGKSYLDYSSALGAIIKGYSDPAVDGAVRETINRGQVLLSLPHPKEADLAEKLAKIMAFAEQSKFFKTGSEACSAAIRVARAVTGKELIASCGYHGWHDGFASSYGRGLGVTESQKIVSFNYHDIDGLEKILRQGCAGVILEPVVFDEPKNNFLELAVKLAHQYSSLVIFDEIITGFRFSDSGAAGFFNLEPDLACFSKAMGNGYSIAALVGKSDFMSIFDKHEFFVSGTFGGDLIGISAALAVLDTLTLHDIWINGTALKNSFNSIAKDMQIEAECIGYAPRTSFKFETEAHRALFWQECVKRGVLFGYSNFPTMSHRELVLDVTAGIMEDALKIVKKNWSNPTAVLEGKLPAGVPIR